jgi:hypothetical protein
VVIGRPLVLPRTLLCDRAKRRVAASNRAPLGYSTGIADLDCRTSRRSAASRRPSGAREVFVRLKRAVGRPGVDLECESWGDHHHLRGRGNTGPPSRMPSGSGASGFAPSAAVPACGYPRTSTTAPPTSTRSSPSWLGLLSKGPSEGPLNPPRRVPAGQARQHNAIRAEVTCSRCCRRRCSTRRSDIRSRVHPG